MNTRASRLLPAAAALLALGLTSACGGGSGSDDGDNPENSARDKASSAPANESSAQPGEGGSPGDGGAAVPAKTLSVEELEKAVLDTEDLSGYTVRTPSEEDVSGAGEEKAAKAECQPLASVIGGIPQPEPADIVYRQVFSTSDEEAGTIIFEMLAAYERESADRMMDDLRAAVKTCAGGFVTKAGTDTNTYSAVKGLTAPSGADDALAYQVNGDLAGNTVPLLFHVVRSGSTVAVFYAMDFTGSSTPEIPQSMVTAQIDKLT